MLHVDSSCSQSSIRNEVPTNGASTRAVRSLFAKRLSAVNGVNRGSETESTSPMFNTNPADSLLHQTAYWMQPPSRSSN